MNAQIMAAMDKVKKGELDLMGAMIYNDSLARTYDYTSTNYGMGNMAIYVLSDNDKINDTNIYSLKTLNVGILSTNHQENPKLKEFGEASGINIKQHFYDNGDQMLADLNNKKIESIAMSEQSNINGDYRIVATFSPRPFYLVTTKGNSQLIAELNESMTKLNKEQPSFMSELHERYFSLKSDRFTLTDKEKEFIKNHPTVDVALLGGKAPLQSRDEKGQPTGITIDVLEYIGKLSGIKFNYHYTESYEEYQKLLKDDNILVAGGVSGSYREDNEKFVLSRTYLDSSIEIIMTKGQNASEIAGKRLALPRGMSYLEDYKGEVVYYDTAADCFRAVNNGDVDYSYLSSHVALFYNSSEHTDNITIMPQEGNYNIKSCFAVSTDATPLLNILNKGVDNASISELQSIVFKNATNAKEDPSLINYIKSNPSQFISFIIAIAGIYLLLRYNTNKRNNAKLVKEYNRFQQISDLSGDCFIEYNVATDSLTLSGGAAGLLSPEKKLENYLSNPYVGNDMLRMVVDSHSTYDQEKIVSFLDGTKRWQRVFLQPIFDDNNHLTHVIGKITDIQAQKEEQLLWKELARRDSLTKVYNSAACREMFNEFLNSTTDDAIALLILDIDNFKYINDNFGHYYGDCVLQKLAESIVCISKPTDIVARVGGDEFIVGLKYPESMESIETYCETLKTEIANYKDYTITISMGVALSRTGQTYDDLYQIADVALYDAKNAGRNNYQFANKMKKND